MPLPIAAFIVCGQYPVSGGYISATVHKSYGSESLVRLTLQFNHGCLREVLHPYCVSVAASLHETLQLI